MQNLYLLQKDIRFDLIAELLMPTALQLTDVMSCTFPSRPEPKSATWLYKEKRMLDYHYLPDIEIRYLFLRDTQFLNDRNFLFFIAELTNVNLFTEWDALEVRIFGEYRENVYAINAFKLGLKHEKGNHTLRPKLIDSLLLAIAENDQTTSEILAEVFREIASSEMLDALRFAYEETKSALVRSHLREAMNYAMNRTDF